MILALEDAAETRVYLAGDPAQSEDVNGHLVLEKPLHERKQVVHNGVGWINVKTRDLGNGRCQIEGWHYRTFDTYIDALDYAILGTELTEYEGTAVLLLPQGSGIYRVRKMADATVMPQIEKPIGVTVKVNWIVQGAYPTNEGTEVIAGDTLGDPGTGDTVGDPDTGDIAGDPTV